MQLLIILALLLMGGKSGAGKLLEEVKPVLESFGGEEIQKALKSAEEISSVISAVQSVQSASVPDVPVSFSSDGEKNVSFPLAPVSAIADKDITYSLSRYISQN